MPARLAPVSHFDAMLNLAGVRVIVESARGPAEPWSRDQVQQARRIVFGAE